jgi:glucosamine 6-phosphate synthetase-like amidotransferase/phosphosugar isomerase protein
LLIEDLIISAHGTSEIAARYGAHIMRQLGIFDTVRIIQPHALTQKDFKDMKYGGYLTLSQSGSGQSLTNALKLAYQNHLTCFNIVNVEDSPITRVIDELIQAQKS